MKKMTYKIIKTEYYLLIVDDSDIIGEGYWFDLEKKVIILKDKYSVYKNDSFKKIIAHLPISELPILKGAELLPPYSRYQEDGVEEYAESCNQLYKAWSVTGYKSGYNKACENYKYTEHDMRSMFEKTMRLTPVDFSEYMYNDTRIFNDLLKSLHQYPKEFECEMEEKHSSYMPEKITAVKTIATVEGIQWVGKYK
jgi:hypothetical protein